MTKQSKNEIEDVFGADLALNESSVHIPRTAV